MDETVLEPTGTSTSEAGREGPELRSKSPRPAPLGIRLAARCFDFVILLLLFEFFTEHTHRGFAKSFFIAPTERFGFGMEMGFHVLVFSILVGGVFLRLAAIYFLCNYWSLFGSGRSLGKRMTQIRIADVGDGKNCPLRPLGFSRIFRREALFLLAVTPLFVAWCYGLPPAYKMVSYGLSVLLLVFEALPAFFLSRRSLLDRIAGTWVCDLKSSAPSSPFTFPCAETEGAKALKEDKEQLSDDEWNAAPSRSCEVFLEPAPLWRRACAWAVDFVVLGMVMDFTGRARDYIFHGELYLFRSFGLRTRGEDAGFLLMGGILFAYLLYALFVYLLMNYVKLRRSGQSIGKGVGRVRIVCMEGGRMGIVRMLLREAPFLISVSLLVFTMDFTLGIRFSSPSFIWDRWWDKLGFILMFCVKVGFVVFVVDALPGLFGSRRCIHDRLADTRVGMALPPSVDSGRMGEESL